jgi:integrase/recombinase XerD
MDVSQAAQSYREYHRLNSKKNTLKNYDFVFSRFNERYGNQSVESVSPDDILKFLTSITDHCKPATRHHRYCSLKAFFNFIRNSADLRLSNPYDTPMLRKIFRERPSQPRTITEKDLVDEIIFRTTKPRNRIMLELMARGGMRIGEVLKMRHWTSRAERSSWQHQRAEGSLRWRSFPRRSLTV